VGSDLQEQLSNLPVISIKSTMKIQEDIQRQLVNKVQYSLEPNN